MISDEEKQFFSISVLFVNNYFKMTIKMNSTTDKFDYNAKYLLKNVN